jgi:hypothetical protein
MHTFDSTKGVVVRNHSRRIFTFPEKAHAVAGLETSFLEVPDLAAVYWKGVVEKVEKEFVIRNCQAVRCISPQKIQGQNFGKTVLRSCSKTASSKRVE